MGATVKGKKPKIQKQQRMQRTLDYNNENSNKNNVKFVPKPQEN